MNVLILDRIADKINEQLIIPLKSLTNSPVNDKLETD